MSGFELKPGQGTMFINDKGGVETRPDRRGELNIDGTIYELAGWIRDGRKGQYLWISAKPKEQPQANGGSKSKAAFDDSDPPF